MTRHDLHAHKCSKCSHVWEHFLSQIPEAHYDFAHECPKCGTESRTHYEKHHGDLPPMSCHNGARTIDYTIDAPVITAEERQRDHTARDVVNVVVDGWNMGPANATRKPQPFGGLLGIMIDPSYEGAFELLTFDNEDQAS